MKKKKIISLFAAVALLISCCFSSHSLLLASAEEISDEEFGLIFFPSQLSFLHLQERDTIYLYQDTYSENIRYDFEVLSGEGVEFLMQNYRQSPEAIYFSKPGDIRIKATKMIDGVASGEKEYHFVVNSAPAPTVTFENIAKSYKIGERFWEPFYSGPDAQLKTFAHAENLPYGLLWNNFSGEHQFMSTHAGTAIYTNDDHTGEFKTNLDTVYWPGTYTFQLSVSPAWADDPRAIAVGEPFTFTVEEPIIKTTDLSNVKEGQEISFQTFLTNTALENDKVANYTSLEHENVIAYQPSVEILEGADLIKQSNQDYSNILSTSETLTFDKPGTVTLKIRYQQINTCDYCLVEDAKPFSPETTITFEVKDKNAPDPQPEETNKKALQESVDKAAALIENEYTTDSWSNMQTVLDEANSILKDPNATKETVTAVKQELDRAIANLVKKDSSSGESMSSKNDSSKQDASATSSADAPKTGDSLPVFALGTLLLFSGALLTIVKKRNL